MVINKHANRGSLARNGEVNPVPSLSIFTSQKGVNYMIKITSLNKFTALNIETVNNILANIINSNCRFEYAKEGQSTIEMVRIIDSE